MVAIARTRSSITYLAVLAAAGLCYAALGAVVAILPSYIPDSLGGGPTTVGLTVGAPAFTGLIGRPLGGRAGDLRGPLVPVLAGAATMAAGTVPAAASATETALLVSRLAVGLGEGMMMGASVLWLLRLAGPARRGRALGHIGLANYGGLALGPLLSTALGGARASTAILWAATALPLIGAAAALGAARLPSTKGPGAHAVTGKRPVERSRPRSSTRALLRQTAPGGAGLLLVNIGYVSVLAFGAAVAGAHHTGLQALIVPLFAAVVIVSRTVAGGIPDRLGPHRTVVAFAGAEAVGLLIYADAASSALALAALLTLSVGQSLAVPGLGLLALAGVPAADQGAAAGLFFAWFDAGVGMGGLTVGAVASGTGAGGALDTAAAALAAVTLVTAVAARRAGSRGRRK